MHMRFEPLEIKTTPDGAILIIQPDADEERTQTIKITIDQVEIATEGLKKAKTEIVGKPPQSGGMVKLKGV